MAITPDEPEKRNIVPDAAPVVAQPAGIVPMADPMAELPIQPAGIVPTPEFTASDIPGAAGDLLLSAVSSIYGEPMAGLAGLATMALTNNPDAASAVIDGVRQQLIWMPKTKGGQMAAEGLANTVGKAMGYLEQNTGDVVFNATGDPGLAAWASSVPAGFAEVVGALTMKNTAKAVRSQRLKNADDNLLKARDYENVAKQLELEADRITSPKSVDEAIAVFRQMDRDELAQSLQSNPEFFRAADELGINTEPLAIYAAQNPAARDILGNLQALPGSQLAANAKAYVTEVTNKAQNLIEEYGGTLDKAHLSDEFMRNSMGTIDEIFQQEDAIYSAIRQNIDPATRVVPSQTRSLIKHFEREFGGEDKLPKAIRNLKKQLNVQEVTDITGSGMMGTRKRTTRTNEAPTYYKLDDERRLVGQAIEKQDGPFKDVDVARLKRLYGAMRDDVDIVAEQHGFLDDLKTANQLTQNRKLVEDNLKGLLTRNLNRDLSTVIGQGLKGVKGQTARFKDIVNSLNEIKRVQKGVRNGKHQIMDPQQIVLSALNDAMRGSGSQQGVFSANHFVKFMNELNQQPSLKKLVYSNIPKESHKALENLYTVAKGIDEANKYVVKTGRTLSLLDERGIVGKLTGKVGSAAGRITGGLGGDMLMDYLQQRSKVSVSATEMLASPEFQRFLRETVTEGVKKGVYEGTRASKKLQQAEAALLQSKKYQKWANDMKKSGLVPDEVLMLLGTSPATYFSSQQPQVAEQGNPGIQGVQEAQ